MTDHAAIALDQLRNADDHVTTPAEQTIVFAAAAIVHSNLAILEAMKTPKASVIRRRAEAVYQQLVDESAGYNPTP